MLLEKMLQSQGFGSRKHCQLLIKNGAVSIQNEIIDDPKHKLNLQDLTFSIYVHEYRYREKVYIALNKPQDYECSHLAPQHSSLIVFPYEMLFRRGGRSS